MKKLHQYEIRVYAEAMAAIVKQVAPWSYEAFEDYWMNGARLSSLEWGAISSELTEEQRASILKRLEHTLSAGELRELEQKLSK
jgi:thymidylate synthase (FAD)